MKQRPNFVVFQISHDHGLYVDAHYFVHNGSLCETSAGVSVEGLHEEVQKIIMQEVRAKAIGALAYERTKLFDTSWFDTHRALLQLPDSAARLFKYYPSDMAYYNNRLPFPMEYKNCLGLYYVLSNEDLSESEIETVYLLCRI